MGPEAGIIIGGSTIAAVAVVASAVYNTVESSFLYSNARLASRQKLSRRQLMAMQESESLKEIITQLRDTDYYLYVENAHSLDAFAASLEQRFGDLLFEIGKMTPRKFHPVLDIYFMHVESHAIKVFFRSRFSDKELEQQSTAAFESLQPILFHSLMNTKTVADMKVVLRDTKYSNLFENSFESIAAFDQAIDAHIRTRTLNAIDTFKFQGADKIRTFFTYKADIQLLLAMLALHIRNIEPSANAEIIKSWGKIQGIDNTRLHTSELKEFVGACTGTIYHKPLLNALKRYEEGEGYHCFEHELYTLLQKQVQSPGLVGSFAIVGFLERQLNEQQNLLVAARGAVTGTTTSQLMIYGDTK